MNELEFIILSEMPSFGDGLIIGVVIQRGSFVLALTEHARYFIFAYDYRALC